MRMPFGKHAGVELTEVPRQYLRWLRRQPTLGAWLAKEIDDVLNGNVVAESDESFEEVLKKWNDESLAHQGDEPAKAERQKEKCR